MKKITFGDVVILISIVLIVITFSLMSQQNVRLKQERENKNKRYKTLIVRLVSIKQPKISIGTLWICLMRFI